MITYKRICIKDWYLNMSDGNRVELKRGTEYITSEEADGIVTVFSTIWLKVPVKIFAGEVRFT